MDWQTNPLYGKLINRLSRSAGMNKNIVSDLEDVASQISDREAKSNIAAIINATKKKTQAQGINAQSRELDIGERQINLRNANFQNEFRLKNRELDSYKNSVLPETLLGAGTAAWDIKSGIDQNKINLALAKRKEDMVRRLYAGVPMPAQSSPNVYDFLGSLSSPYLR